MGAYQSISKRFKWLGWLGIAAAALIFSFYSALGGYCLRYVVVNFGNLIGAEFGTNGVGGADVFQGLLSQPDVKGEDSVVTRALGYAVDPEFPPQLVHRLDRNTSGVMALALDGPTTRALMECFKARRADKRYWAIVIGELPERGRIDVPLLKDADKKLVRVDPKGERAVTEYKRLTSSGAFSLAEVHLLTGRTHQIRVHMKYIGHTLFNDERYGGHDILKGTTFTKYKQFVQNCFAICPRQALHAKTLGFVHPTTGEEMFFDSEIPSDMQQLIDRWRVYANTKEL